MSSPSEIDNLANFEQNIIDYLKSNENNVIAIRQLYDVLPTITSFDRTIVSHNAKFIAFVATFNKNNIYQLLDINNDPALIYSAKSIAEIQEVISPNKLCMQNDHIYVDYHESTFGSENDPVPILYKRLTEQIMAYVNLQRISRNYENKLEQQIHVKNLQIDNNCQVIHKLFNTQTEKNMTGIIVGLGSFFSGFLIGIMCQYI